LFVTYAYQVRAARVTDPPDRLLTWITTVVEFATHAVTEILPPGDPLIPTVTLSRSVRPAKPATEICRIAPLEIEPPPSAADPTSTGAFIWPPAAMGLAPREMPRSEPFHPCVGEPLGSH